MARCEVCGNDYDKAFQVMAAGATHTFVEAGGHFFCCASCARHAGVTSIKDRAAEAA
jgi:hypothetical protein